MCLNLSGSSDTDHGCETMCCRGTQHGPAFELWSFTNGSGLLETRFFSGNESSMGCAKECGRALAGVFLRTNSLVGSQGREGCDKCRADRLGSNFWLLDKSKIPRFLAQEDI